jgi:methionine sulfoxide reductase heme-binding subunit
MKSPRPTSRRNRYAWLQVLAHAAALIPLLVLGWDYFNDNLTINPIQAAQQRTGNIALVLLLLSLAVTPLFTVTRFAPLINLRRPLGLYAFLYASIHLYLFVGVDYGFQFDLILLDVGDKRYILVGLVAFLLLLPLAITSIRWFVVRMGKNWKKLHRIIYLAGALVVLHFAWVVKGDITQLQGDILRPLLAGIILALLLIMRIPPIRKRLADWGRQVFSRPARKSPARVQEELRD